MALIADAFLIFNYLTNYYQSHEKIFYVIFVLAGFLQILNGCAVFYFIKTANEIVTPEEQDKLGSMMFEFILASGCLATILAAFLPTIKLAVQQRLGII